MNQIFMPIRKFLRERYLIRSIYRLIVCVYKGFPLKTLYLCEIQIETIPKTVFFIHPYSIVIRNNTIIGENCIIRQNVTIGQRRQSDTEPTIIGNNVNIGAGAIILGSIKNGDNVYIGAGAIVLKDVPPNMVITGTWK